MKRAENLSEKSDKKSIFSLRFEKFNTGNPGDKVALCESSFLLWKDIWNHAFEELGVNKKVWSDDFLHRDLVGFFDGDRAVGFVLFRYLDFDRATHRMVSYFQNHPEDVLEKSFGPRDLAQISSHITIHPDWTKSKTDYPMSEILISFLALDFMEHPTASRMLAYLRNSRGIQNIFYRHGAKALAQNVFAYNCEVDFVEITKQEVHLSVLPHCDQVATYFWNQLKGEKHDTQFGIRSREHSTPFEPRSEIELAQPPIL
jgi:hypothetical protein